MEVSENLECLFSVELEKQDGSYVIEIPAQELEHGTVDPHGTYRVAVLGTDLSDQDTASATTESTDSDDPPVETGDTRTVGIIDHGKQGDGIAKVERGYVIIVPDAEIGATVTVEIVHVADSYAVAEVTDTEPDSDIVYE